MQSLNKYIIQSTVFTVSNDGETEMASIRFVDYKKNNTGVIHPFLLQQVKSNNVTQDNNFVSYRDQHPRKKNQLPPVT